MLLLTSKTRPPGWKVYDDSGVFFSDNFSESQGDDHKLVTMRYAGDIGTCVQHVEDASPFAYVGEAAQIAAALHGAAGLGHGHPARARPPELSVSGRIDATNAVITRDPTNVPNQRRRRRRLNQAGQRAEANRIIWGEIDYNGPDEVHKVHIRQGTSKGST